MGKTQYSRLATASNGEINQRCYYGNEKIPMRSMESDMPLNGAGGGYDHSIVSNYATFREKSNGYVVTKV